MMYNIPLSPMRTYSPTDITIIVFIFATAFICLREGIRGIWYKRCRTPLNPPPHFEGTGAEAVIWGVAYLCIGLLYCYYIVESVTYGLVRSIH